MILDYCTKDATEWLNDISKAKASGKGVTVLEIAERCQDPHATGPNIRPSTPRSAEAVLRSGVDPEDLVHKPPQFFLAKTGDPDLGRLAYQFYEEVRQKRIDDIRALRQSLIDDGWQPLQHTPSGKPENKNDVSTADMVERERKRLEALRNRQQRELDQLVEYEVKRAQMQAKAEAKLEKQNERARKLAAAKVEKEKAWREALRGQEINRLALEKAEEQKKKRADKERFMNEQEFLAMEKTREKEMRAEAYRKEKDRISKAEQARLETERIHEAQQKVVEARKRDMACRDAERESKKAEKQRIMAEENEQKRKQAAQRLTSAYAANLCLLENKRANFHAREEASAARRSKQAIDREALERAKREMLVQKAEKRKEVYSQAVKQQSDKVVHILHKAAAQQESMDRERYRFGKELARRKLQRQLNAEYRMECVDTNRKQQLYAREVLLQKISMQTERVMQLRRDAAALQMQRKAANMQAAVQRQNMVEAMDKLQQANKFDKIASGESSIHAMWS